MKVVGLTGGIGSGKSTIANMFQDMGIAVYIADKEAKQLMNTDETLQAAIVDLLGEKAYQDGALNRAYIANKVFRDKALLEALNSIVHPAVAKDFNNWKNKQKGQYVIKEAAILFENGGYKKCDYTILVVVPEEERIRRVMQRDNTTEEQVKDRMKNQWTDDQKVPFADFVIRNNNLKNTHDQVQKIHNKIILLSSCE
ncbi:dephospho-CoA kinase [Aquimarina hainanensis]|uniref:Dephospho-CoA kinase n=1 Tax=Aquimarina hainanensis TaxID=1578017 RepID=A0ABW5NDG9_9FLAO